MSLLDFDLTALDQYESPRPNEPEDEAFAMTDFDYYEHCMVHGFDGRNLMMFLMLRSSLTSCAKKLQACVVLVSFLLSLLTTLIPCDKQKSARMSLCDGQL